MKKLLLLIGLLMFSAMIFAGQMVKVDLNVPGLKKYRDHSTKGCKIENNILSISGNPKYKYNGWNYVVIALPFNNVANKKFTFGGNLKADIKKGMFSIDIRVIDAKNKTISYQTISIKKTQDWKKVEKSFVANKNAKKLQFYIVGRGLGDASTGFAKDLYIKEDSTK